MILEYLVGIICFELIVYLAIKIIYWFDYTNSYIHCHCNSEPYKPDNEVSFSIDLDEEQTRELLKQFDDFGDNDD